MEGGCACHPAGKSDVGVVAEVASTRIEPRILRARGLELTIEERAFDIMCNALRLEGRLHEGAPGGMAWLVLHPHPQYGGDMDNHVVRAICETTSYGGCTTLRLNFRGAGRSEGAYEGGLGERLDALAGVEALRSLGCKRVGIAGYSFGAAIAASVAQEARAEALVLVSPPAMGAAVTIPKGISTLAVTGGLDPVSPPVALEALGGDDTTVVVVPSVDHGWWPGVDALCQHIAAFQPV